MSHNQELPTHTADEVATILHALREEIAARRATLAAHDAAHSTLTSLERQLQQGAEQLEITRVVSAHWPLESTNLIQRGVFFIHKVVRRGLRWYINPIVEQQNAFNETATRTLRLLIEAHSELRRELAELGDGGNSSPAPAPPPPATPPAPAPSSDDQPTLQRYVEQQGRNEPPAHFTELAIAPFVAQLALQQNVNAHWLISGTSLREQLAAYTQRLIRLYLRWLINPIVEQQNSFNAALTSALTSAYRLHQEARAAGAARRVRRARRTR